MTRSPSDPAEPLVSYEVRDALWLAALLDEASGDERSASRQPEEPQGQPDRPLPAPATASRTRPDPDPVEYFEYFEYFESKTFEPLPVIDVLSGRVTAEPDSAWPTVPPLARKRHVTRALYPFKQGWPSPDQVELDEEETAVRASADALWLPVTRRTYERRWKADLVIDTGLPTALHQPTIDALVDALLDVAAFRDFRTHVLDTGSEEPRLGGVAANRVSRMFARTCHPRLVILLTDGVGKSWHTGRTHQLLGQWGRSAAVAVVHLLAPRDWQRTGLTVEVGGLWSPGQDASNLHYRVQRSPHHGGASHPMAVPIPVVALDAEELGRWARFCASAHPIRRDMAVLTAEKAEIEWPAEHGASKKGGYPRSARENPDEAPPASPAERVRKFRAVASPTAFRLAVDLAAAPLNLRIMRLVQAVMLPESKPWHLAEIFGGGLLQDRSAGRAPADLKGDDNADTMRITFDFRPGVREELLGAGLRSDTVRVLNVVSERLGASVPALDQLRRVLSEPSLSEPFLVIPAMVEYLEPATSALDALGGPYLRPARQLRSSISVHESNRDAAEAPSPGNIAASPTSIGASPTAAAADGPSVAPVSDTTTGTTPSMAPGEGSTAGEDPATLGESGGMPTDTDTSRGGSGVSLQTGRSVVGQTPSPAPSIWGNIPPRNINFTGRDELLERLHDRLYSDTTAAVLPEALHGMGGVGKSQLAIEYVYRHAREFDLIWWVAAEQPGQIRQSLAELAAALHLPSKGEANTAVPAVIEALRTGRPHANWLLIFDNAEDPAAVRQFFPTNGPGRVLVTSRNSEWKTLASTIEVDVFGRGESIELLQRRGPGLDVADADQLAAALGDLPLAIEQAAVWLQETGTPVEEYLILFRERAAELLEDTRATDYALPVAAAWNVSLDRLRQTNSAALQLLQICAFFAPEPISRRWLTNVRNVAAPPELAEVFADPLKLARAIRDINRYALASVSHRHNTLRLHRLVQTVLISHMNEDEATQLRNCGHLLLANADPGEPDSLAFWPTYAALLPHVLASGALHNAEPWVQELVTNEISFLYRWGDHEECRALAQEAVKVWTRTLGPDHQRTLLATSLLGDALRLLGEFDQAYEMDRRLHDLLSQTRGPEDEETLQFSTRLSWDLRNKGEYRQACLLNKTVYNAFSRQFGENDPTTLQAAHVYGVGLRTTGAFSAALELDQGTYRRRIEVLGDDARVTLHTGHALAFDLMNVGRYEEALAQIERIHTQASRLFDEMHPSVIEATLTMSVAQRRLGNGEEALRLSTQALNQYQLRYGPASPFTVWAAMCRAVDLYLTGDLKGAVKLSTEIVDRHRVMFGSDHPQTLAAVVNLAVCLRIAGKPERARSLNEEAFDAYSARLGKDHFETIICAINLASDMYELGDNAGARALDEQTLRLAEQSLGAVHPTTFAVRLNLNLDLRAVGERGAAEQHYAETLSGYRRMLGDDHPATLAAIREVRANCDIFPPAL